MPREIITIQVGQCGNQIGCRFWELALREHAAYNSRGRYDDALSTFFKNVDGRREPAEVLPVGDGTGPIRTLKARAVLVDMEEGVLHDLLHGPLGARSSTCSPPSRIPLSFAREAFSLSCPP